MNYKSPITASITHINDDVSRNIDDALMVKIQETLEFEIDKDELIKALKYDRRQYEEGFNAGYTNGYKAALEWVICSANIRMSDKIEPKDQQSLALLV